MKAGGTRAGAAPENRDGGRRAVVERLKEYGQTRADLDWNDLDVETRRGQRGLADLAPVVRCLSVSTGTHAIHRPPPRLYARSSQTVLAEVPGSPRNPSVPR